METKPRLDFDRALPIFALTFVDVLGLTIILPLLHLYAAAYGATPLEIGLVIAAFPLSQLIGVPLMGALSDRYGRKPLLLISQVTTCIGFIMLGAANSLFLIILSRVIDGVFGANLSTAQAALSDITDDSTRAQGLGVTGAAFGLGFILGPAISLIALEFSDNLSLPAYIAAAYSFLSILLTLFLFKETLPPERRGARAAARSSIWSILRNPRVNLLLILMFAQQFVFFGFESLLGLFVLSRLGMMGQGNALIFIVVGVVLVIVQVGLIGRWSRKYGERRLAQGALALLASGLLLFSATPQQPHPFYVRRIVENELRKQAPSGTEAVIGEIRVDLPPNGNNGIGGLLWVFAVIVPISIGAGLIRPSLNSLMTRRVTPSEYGRVLGLSASFVSAANAGAPILGGLIFQSSGAAAPFLIGGVVMTGLFLVSMGLLRE
jgi:MFS transporter, DHA1 family, tetracycline resistance protein